jgi:hypothetical protein
LILKTALHPVACSDRESLRKMTKMMEHTLKDLYSLYQLHHASLVQMFVLQRTGILSPDQEVRKLASNVLVAMAWAGHLDKFVQQSSAIFNYSAIEKLD